MNHLPSQELVDALIEQRNRAQNDAAGAAARSVFFQKDNQALRQRIAELEAQIAQLEKKEPACQA